MLSLFGYQRLLERPFFAQMNGMWSLYRYFVDANYCWPDDLHQLIKILDAMKQNMLFVLKSINEPSKPENIEPVININQDQRILEDKLRYLAHKMRISRKNYYHMLPRSNRNYYILSLGSIALVIC